MIFICICREAEKINMLPLSVLEPGITALKGVGTLALDFLKEAAPHPPNPQIYKTSPEMLGIIRDQKPNSGIDDKGQNPKCQRALIITCPIVPSPNKVKEEIRGYQNELPKVK